MPRIPTIAFVLIESNDVGVSKIVRKTSSIPAFRICGKAPLAEVCHHFPKSWRECHPAQEISCSWDVWLQVSYLPWWKGCPVLEGQVAAAGWIEPNSWCGLVGNRWSYSELPSVPSWAEVSTRSAQLAASEGDTFFGIGPMISRIPLQSPRRSLQSAYCCMRVLRFSQ